MLITEESGNTQAGWPTNGIQGDVFLFRSHFGKHYRTEIKLLTILRLISCLGVLLLMDMVILVSTENDYGLY